MSGYIPRSCKSRRIGIAVLVKWKVERLDRVPAVTGMPRSSHQGPSRGLAAQSPTARTTRRPKDPRNRQTSTEAVNDQLDLGNAASTQRRQRSAALAQLSIGALSIAMRDWTIGVAEPVGRLRPELVPRVLVS
jgi:hypothetical protein